MESTVLHVCPSPEAITVRVMGGPTCDGYVRMTSRGASIDRTGAPLGWNVKDPSPVAAACVALFSDLFPATTAEVIHVDGGYHAIGA